MTDVLDELDYNFTDKDNETDKEKKSSLPKIETKKYSTWQPSGTEK